MAPGNELTQKYKEILQSNGIVDEVSEVIVEDSGLHGEGFASISHCITVRFVNPTLKHLNLFVKGRSSNPSHNELVEDLKAFEKEARFFMEYVPVAKKFCVERGMKGFIDFYPKCYYGDENIIVLENLVLDKGYEVVDKTVMQDLEEARFALETLAKHHALGHAMIQEHGGATTFFQKFKNFDYESYAQPVVRKMLEPMVENGLNTLITLLEKYDVDGGKEILDLLKTKIGTLYGVVERTVQYDETKDPLLLFTHGDYWNNNMMFLKDKETRKIIGHKAIDFQVLRYNSPGLDVGYYLFTSVQANVRRAHLHDLVNIYLENLREYSKDLGYPIHLTYDELFLDLRRKFELGFWLGIYVTSGPGLVIIKNIKIEELGDVSNWGVKMGELVQKWIEDNPEKGHEMAKEVVAVMNEYTQLLIE